MTSLYGTSLMCALQSRRCLRAWLTAYAGYVWLGSRGRCAVERCSRRGGDTTGRGSAVIIGYGSVGVDKVGADNFATDIRSRLSMRRRTTFTLC